MSRLTPDRLHVRFTSDTSPDGLVLPRRYTLTHSDRTGDLYLTIGAEYDHRQLSGLYARLLRDEVRAEWLRGKGGLALQVHCHVSGGLVFGSARWRNRIFRQELPLVLAALRFGDQQLFEADHRLDAAPIWVHFHARERDYNRVESWGIPADYIFNGGSPTE